LAEAAFVLAPFGHSVWLSLHRWDGVAPARWIGLENYRDLLTDPAARSAFLHAAALIPFYCALPIVLGLGIAATLRRRPGRSAAFRTIVFLPQVIAVVAVGVIWRAIYQPGGSLDSALRGLGLGALSRPWLGDFELALPSIGVAGAWVTLGLVVTLLVAGAQRIPQGLYDAARAEGAGSLREFATVTLPGLRGELAVAVALTLIASLRSFDLVFVTTGGGPGTATTVPGLLLYNRAFVYGQVGAAAALGVAVTILLVVLVLAALRLAGGRST
jgi:raffinose/stachyose/melibiose transport system permease protein